MIPILISDTFDLQRLHDKNGKALFDGEGRALYVQDANPTVPAHNGLGELGDAKACIVKSPINAPDELVMTYPITGSLFRDIKERCVIVAQPDKTRGPQPFRIYRVTKPLRGIITVYARHLAYDGLSGIPVAPFTASDIQGAMAGLKANAMVHCPFTLSTTRTVSAAKFSVPVPTDIWSLMGGQKGSLLDVYGGEYSFDGYTVRLENRIGQDNGVKVRYGVNMVDLEQDTNVANCYTGVVAYWQSEEDEIHSPVVYAGGNYGYVRILSVDMSERWEKKPTVAQLTTAATKYITDNQIGVPKVSWKVQMVDLSDTEEYKNIAPLERVSRGDTVGVEFEALGVDATARVRSTEWDVLNERYKTITLGSVKANIATTIAAQARELAQRPTKAETRTIAETIGRTLSLLAMGLDGGTIRFIDTNGDDEPDTLYVADNPDPALAVNVWRWDYRGWAGSKNGYNGPFVMGATLEGGILADFITAGVLNAGLVKILSEGDIGSGFGNAIATFNGQFLEGTQENTSSVLWRLGTGVVNDGSNYVASGNLDLYAVGQNIDSSKPVISLGALDDESWGLVIRDPYTGYTGHIDIFFNPDLGIYVDINNGTEQTFRIQEDGLVRCKRLIVNGTEITP